MSVYNRRARRRATFIGAAIGSIIIFTFVLSLVAPGLGTTTSVVLTSVPDTPEPTRIVVPSPEPDPQLGGALPYVHSSGAFQVFRPAGDDWLISDNPFAIEGDRRDVIIQSGRRLVVIHYSVQPGVEFEALDSLSENYLTEAHYAEEWGNYDAWEETGREVTDEAVIVDFDLRADEVRYLGRDLTRLEDGTLYLIRIVVPANNRPLLEALAEASLPGFYPYEQLAALPPAWSAYVDQQLGFVLKYPPGWATVAGAPGRPATLRSGSGEQAIIRLDAQAGRPLASPDDAEAWVLEAEADAEVTGVEPVEHPTASGYRVAYTYRDPSGDRHSALAVLLNDDAGALFVANLQLGAANVDLLDSEGLSDALSQAWRAVVEGFMVLPPDAREALVAPAATEAAP